MHPALHDLGLSLISCKYQSTNQITVAILLVLKQIISDFKQNEDQNGQTPIQIQLLTLIRDKI